MTPRPMTKAKRRKAKGKAPKPKPIDEAIIDEIVLILVSGLQPAAVVETVRTETGLPPDRTDEAIAEARLRIARAADYARDAVLGESITRLDALYNQAIVDKETTTALAALKEKNRLLGLGPAVTDDPGADDPADADDPDARRVIEDDELAAVVGSIERHIDPLKLTDNMNHTDADAVRLAGQEIKRLRRQVKRLQRKAKKTKTT